MPYTEEKQRLKRILEALQPGEKLIVSDSEQKNKDIANVFENEASSLTEKEQEELRVQLSVMTSYYRRYRKVISGEALSREVEGEQNGGIYPTKPKQN